MLSTHAAVTDDNNIASRQRARSVHADLACTTHVTYEQPDILPMHGHGAPDPFSASGPGRSQLPSWSLTEAGSSQVMPLTACAFAGAKKASAQATVTLSSDPLDCVHIMAARCHAGPALPAHSMLTWFEVNLLYAHLTSH